MPSSCRTCPRCAALAHADAFSGGGRDATLCPSHGRWGGEAPLRPRRPAVGGWHDDPVANMASYAISSSLILVIHDNMIIGTNHTVLACLCRHF
jgi:hypothetical protein